MRTLVVVVGALCVSLAGCRCGGNVNQVNPSLGVSPASLDFGQVKNGDRSTKTLKLEAQTRAPVVFSSITIEGEGAAAYSLGTTPAQVDALSTTTLQVTFAPTELRAYTATLVIASNDPDHATIRVVLAGEGAKPILEVTPECEASRMCVGTVVLSPPSIDFGAEPTERLMPIDPTRLPAVNVVNAGPVVLKVTKAAIEGADAAAFTFAGNAMIPASGLELDPSAGFNLAIRFKPTSEMQASYAATLVIESDDPDNARVTVALKGTLRPNLPPVVCANLVRVVPPPEGDAPREYNTAMEWDSLRMPPPGGYDFTSRRDVRPNELAVFSALSGSDVSTCTNDPEDGRTSLTWAWRLASAPPGAQNLPLSGSATPQVQLRPIVTGEYVLELTVRDVQMHATTVTMKFAVAIKQDLVAQLQWTGAADVDLDVHLVRPSAVTSATDPFSGAFSFFSAGAANKTAGDINGYAVTTQRAMPGAGFDFDWGAAGSSDDPKLNLDDTGAGALLENASLNYPENDALCATASCTYKVLVHYFKDARSHPMPAGCFVDGGVGCADGEACTCASAQRCVADSAPVGDAGVGAGKCYPAPKPVVRLFFKGSPTPANVIPLDTLVPPDELSLGAPCQMLYVADIAWPAKTAIGSLPDGGTPPPVVTVKGADAMGRVTPVIGRFGWRQTGGSLQCSPDVTLSGVQWYSRQP